MLGDLLIFACGRFLKHVNLAAVVPAVYAINHLVGQLLQLAQSRIKHLELLYNVKQPELLCKEVTEQAIVTSIALNGLWLPPLSEAGTTHFARGSRSCHS